MIEVTVDNDQLVIEWEKLPRWMHDETCESLRAINGARFDKKGKRWVAPVTQADKVLAALPDASFSYEAICHAVNAEGRRCRILYQNLLDCGFELSLRRGRVIVSGEAATPVLQQYVDEYPNFHDYLCVYTLKAQHARNRL